MNSNILSRASIVIPDKQLLVNIVRLRVRQLVAGHRPLIAVPPGMGLSDVALSEIAENKLTSESKTAPDPDALAAPIITFPSTAAVKKKAAWSQSPAGFQPPLPMITAPPPPSEQLDARGYRRAHAGKLMIIQRSDDTHRSARDFFHIEDVGTHPTGLLVTGIFDNNRRGHMLASSVRAANAAEIEWQAAAHAAQSPEPARSS